MQKLLDYRIALVAAEWHKDLVGKATTSCLAELANLGVSTKQVHSFKVPGSLELPLMAKQLAESGEWDAVIVFGLVVDGGIYRHEFVAQAVLNGIVRVGLDTGVPVLSVVLTPKEFNEKDSETMHFLSNHLQGKGVEAAQSAVGIIQALSST